MTDFNKTAFIRDIETTESLIVTWLERPDKAIDMLMKMDSVEDMQGVIGGLLGFIASNIRSRLESHPDLTLEQVITDIRLGYIEQLNDID